MAADAKKTEDKKVLLRNKRARHDYFVEWSVEAGVVLQGSEVKSLREAKATMSDAYAMVRHGEAWLVNLQINEYAWANYFNHPPKRDRKLLLHRKEIEKLDEASMREGYTLLPLEIYLSKGRIKVEIGVCKGKKQHDKREDQKRKDAQREVAAAMRNRR
ncbi:MAG TPA: SsrA-binding protein SmpB [Polyangia bacterium]|jgi:SsrA-binding protein|nr:SsrA-binding protein SmpB [Polyangia bacterium]HWE30963.1 SsrA-binding protein SmpB [Polyangia bacterium]